MKQPTFWQEMSARIAKYDLLCHPYYQAWKSGELTRQDLCAYASNYYHHVNAFTDYLDVFQSRLPEGPMKAAILQNKQEELGVGSRDGRTHSDLWLDFAEGMGADRLQVPDSTPIAEMQRLIGHFSRVAQSATPVEALACFYAYESQVPNVAQEKERGLRDQYAADAKTRFYFHVHKTADLEHSQVWRDLIDTQLQGKSESCEAALNAAESAASMLWQALDGMETLRKQAQAVAVQ